MSDDFNSGFNGFSWVYGIWYCGDGETGDFMGTLGRRDGKLVFEYRFRYYSPKSKNPFDAEDEKKWYAFAAKDKPAHLARFLEMQKVLCAALKEQFGSDVDFVDLQCNADDPKIMFELGSRPWAHMKQMSLEEYNATHGEL